MKNYSILIIEDSERDRLTYRHYLLANQNFKYQILEAQGLTEGLELWRTQSPDLVLVDINLPDGSGLELLKVVNNRYSRQPLPTIVISGLGNERIAVQAMKLGASDYLAKDDITASTLCQAVENALQQWNLTKDIQQRTHFGSWELDVLTGKLTWSKELFEIFRINPANATLTFDYLSSYFTPHSNQVRIEVISRAIQYGEPFEVDLEIIRADGTRGFILSKAIPQRDDTGKVVYLWGGTVDISDRKKTERALQLSEARFRRLFDANIVGMLFADLQGRIIDANDCFLQELGYTRQELNQGLIRWDQITPSEYAQQDEELRKQIQKIGYFLPVEKEYYRKDGSRLAILLGGAFLPGSRDQTICIAMNISDRKLAEIKLQQSNQELARATRLRDEFLANMSHELRTPLNAILGMTEGLKEQVYGPLNPKQLDCLETIERSGLHLLELINDILDLSKIESGQLTLDYHLTAIAPLCQASLAFIQQQAFNKHIQIQAQIPQALPDVWIDERRIRQVLINLLNNAVKFTPEGGNILLTIAPMANPSTQSFLLRISIIDNGIGIAPENTQKLFQPFVQVDSALNRQYEGTGLGLALVKNIVELHGGQVSLQSELGKGSCFSVDLPCADCESFLPNCPIAPSILAEKNHKQETRAESSRSFLILLAEDNAANVLAMSDYLTIKGYRLIVANNGEMAISLARSEQPDLILMDIQMPGMNGLDAIKQIRMDANLAQIPIIALTALAMPGDRDRCLEAGANEYVSKPVRLKQLTSLIQEMLTSVNE